MQTSRFCKLMTIYQLMQTSLRTIPETEGFRKQERRRYPRVHYVWPIRFRELNGRPTPLLHAAQSKNLSQSGMKITSIVPLQRNAITLLELNLKSLAVIVPADDILMIDERHILVEVVWRRLNLESRLFETGLRFLERKRRRDYEALISRAKYFSSPLVGEGVIHHTNSGTTFRGKSL